MFDRRTGAPPARTLDRPGPQGVQPVTSRADRAYLGGYARDRDRAADRIGRVTSSSTIRMPQVVRLGPAAEPAGRYAGSQIVWQRPAGSIQDIVVTGGFRRERPLRGGVVPQYHLLKQSPTNRTSDLQFVVVTGGVEQISS